MPRGSKPGEHRGGRAAGTPNKPKGEKALVVLDQAEAEIRVLIEAGARITALGKDRLTEIDDWAYKAAKRFAPREDKNGDPYWKNPGDEARFDRYLKLSAKCALGRAQFESPRYAAVKGERALVKLDAAEREVRVIVAAGEDIAKLGKDRLAELDAWAYGLAQKFAPVEDENGNTHWKNEGDELRFFRFMTFCGKCAAARAQFESPRYAPIAVANQEGQKIPDIYKQDPYKVMDDIIDRWFAAAAAERAEKALDITPTPELEPVAKPDPDDGIDGELA